jgi:hypothetical protein
MVVVRPCRRRLGVSNLEVQLATRRKTNMPKAFSLTYGLDLETEVASFWAWLHDARDAMNNIGEPGKAVRELIETQQEEIDRFIAREPDPVSAKRTLTLALALVGFHYASHQKLLNGLQQLGHLQPVSGTLLEGHETVVETPFEELEPPR